MLRCFMSVFIMVAFTASCYCRSTQPIETSAQDSQVSSVLARGEHVHRAVQQMPKFPGGTAALLAFVRKNLIYPEKAKTNEVEGEVIVQFVVGKDGAVSDAKVVISLSPETDAEALRIVSLLPNFKPGVYNGEKVNVWYTLPITFNPRMMDY